VKILGYTPRNAYLRRQLDRRWRRWLSLCAAGAVGVVVVLAGIVGPRQTTVHLRYEITQAKEEVDRLEREQRALLLRREADTSRAALAADAASLGLAPVPPDRLLYLTADGSLVRPAPSPTAAPGRKDER
jgi:hypothetical protein